MPILSGKMEGFVISTAGLLVSGQILLEIGMGLIDSRFLMEAYELRCFFLTGIVFCYSVTLFTTFHHRFHLSNL